jgi:hypothetical protein
MSNKTLFRFFNLQLFADGAGAGEGGTGDSGATGATGMAAASQTKGEKVSLEDVKYGVQEATKEQAAAVQQETKAQPDRAAEFKKLIDGEYKDLYDENVQAILKKRLKGTNETVEKYNALAPTLEVLSKKYGVDASDIEALNKAIEEDDSFYEQEAIDRGMTVEHLKEVRKMERENAELKRQMQEKETRENANKLYASWMEQSEQIKTVYPSFNLQAEMQNPRFVELLRSNIDMRTAYEVLHKDDIIRGAMQFTAKTVEQKVANKIIANGARPAENGTSSQSAAVVKSDVSQLSYSDMDEVNRRVLRGEKISFGSTRK